MAIRTDTDDFPYTRGDKGVWYLLIEIDKGNIKTSCFSSGKGDENSLGMKIVNYILQKKKFEVYGIWTGDFWTDLFKFDSRKLLNKINMDMSYKEAVNFIKRDAKLRKELGIKTKT